MINCESTIELSDVVSFECELEKDHSDYHKYSQNRATQSGEVVHLVVRWSETPLPATMSAVMDISRNRGVA